MRKASRLRFSFTPDTMVLTTLVIILLSIVPNTQVSPAEATTTDLLITDLVALCWTILNFWLSYRLFCRQQVIGKFINW